MGLIFAVAIIVLMVMCYKKEGKVTGIYKSANVYGRFYAYITVTCMYGAIACLIGGFASFGLLEDATFPEILGILLFAVGGGAIWGAIGFFLYKRAYNRCPEPLRKKLLISMIITAFGTALKIFLFFLPGIWDLVGPQEKVGSNGETLYVYNGEVYDAGWNHVGTASADGETYIKK